ncbi:MAG: hypothetical protein H7Y15_12060, partial [Pseudonocardia sp.]|nr:hypothetical protein [Pseudonocardia sp.]
MSEWLIRPDSTRLCIREDAGRGRPVATVVMAHCYALDMGVWDPLCERLGHRFDRPVRLLRLD